MWEQNVHNGLVPVTLINYSDQERQEMIFNSYSGNAFPTPTQTPELHLTHLPSEESHSLMQNKQLGM